MTNHSPVDERHIYDAVQKIIGSMLDFDADSRMRIHMTVGAFFGFENSHARDLQRTSPTAESPNDPREPHFSTHEQISPKDFLFQKVPNTAVERVVCLAYYLTHYRDTPHFKTTDISKLNTEAAQAKLSNASYTVGNATRDGYLAAATKGMKQLSAHGEKYVEALPDRAAAKALMSSRRPRRSRAKSGNNNTANPSNRNGKNE